MDGMNQKLAIPVRGLPMGGSSFNFVIDGKFFQEFGNTQIKAADCSVKVSVFRHQTLLDVGCMIGGYVVVECDRCLEDLTIKVDVDEHLTAGFGNVEVDEEDDEEDVVVIDSSESELDLSQFVYDYVCLSLPLVKVHPEGKCNPEMLKYLSDAAADADEPKMDTPFEGLKDMLDNRNN